MPTLPRPTSQERLRQRSSRTVGVLRVARNRLSRVNRITRDLPAKSALRHSSGHYRSRWRKAELRQCRRANCSASPRVAQPCMSTILPSRKVMTKGFLPRSFPSSSLSCAVPMTLSSPTRARVRLSIVQPPRAFKTSRASLGPRQEGVCFHQRWPRDGPRHSASSAKREANGSGSPRFSASAAARSSSITVEVWRSRLVIAIRPGSRWPRRAGASGLSKLGWASVPE